MGRAKEDEAAVKARGGRTNTKPAGLELPASFPVMPKGILPAQRVYWNYFCDVMLSANILTTVDAQILLTLCDECSQRDAWIKTREDDIKNGNMQMYETPNGTWTVKPYVNQITKLDASIKITLDKLGMTPKARINLKPIPQGKKGGSRPNIRGKKK